MHQVTLLMFNNQLWFKKQNNNCVFRWNCSKTNIFAFHFIYPKIVHNRYKIMSLEDCMLFTCNLFAFLLNRFSLFFFSFGFSFVYRNFFTISTKFSVHLSQCGAIQMTNIGSFVITSCWNEMYTFELLQILIHIQMQTITEQKKLHLTFCWARKFI